MNVGWTTYLDLNEPTIFPCRLVDQPGVALQILCSTSDNFKSLCLASTQKSAVLTSLISTTLPLMGMYTSLAALTDSTEPKDSLH